MDSENPATEQSSSTIPSTSTSQLKRPFDMTSPTESSETAPATKKIHAEAAESATTTPSTIKAPVDEAVSSQATSVFTVKADQEEEEMAMAAASTSTPSKSSTKSDRKDSYRGGGKGKGNDGKSKYKGKIVTGWGPRTGGGDEGSATPTGEDAGPKEKKYPKKKVAVMLGFSGAGYSGMQIQTDSSQSHKKTIEGELFAALVKAGAISKDNSDDHRKVDLQRAARTDAGVSAAGNVVSLKMIVEPPGIESAEAYTAHINSFLPPNIRMWGWSRVLGSFNARTACQSRVYEYLFPTYMLLPPKPGSALDKQIRNQSSEELPVHPFWAEGAGSGDAEEGAENGEGASKYLSEVKRKRAYRASKEEVENFRSLAKMYVGTHNFHNFTLYKPFNDRTVKRYIMSVDVADPQIYGNLEWVSVKIHGQSFMLHQIRKMMSLALFVARTNTPASLIPETFGPQRIHIPKAPALGLLLEQPQFASYHDRVTKVKNSNNQATDDGKLDFEQYRAEIDAFKVREIYERLREDEERESIFVGWTATLDASPGSELSYLNSKGIIPKEATKVEKGKDKAHVAMAGESDDEATKGGDDE